MSKKFHRWKKIDEEFWRDDGKIAWLRIAGLFLFYVLVAWIGMTASRVPMGGSVAVDTSDILSIIFTASAVVIASFFAARAKAQ
jgi:hypothetical protein